MITKKILLPPGFADVLPPRAAQESRAVANLLRTFASFGYEQVKAPIIEFASGILESNTEDLSAQTFQVSDPDSGEMLAIRPDMTMQIARIATARLQDEPRPLRLSYAGQVLRVKGEGIYSERQLSQAGAELIGADTIIADAESVTLAVTALNEAGVNEISVDFNLPKIPKLLGASDGLIAAISQKNRSDILNLAGDKSEIYESLLDCNSGNLSELKAPDEIKEQIENLNQIITTIKESLPGLQYSVDLLEERGFEYYTGFSFSIFSKDSEDELGRGGRYEIGEGESSSGFSLSVNAVLRALPEKSDKEKIFLAQGTSPEEAAKLREEGLITIYSVDNADDDVTAKALNCEYTFKDGKKIKL